MTNTDWAVLFDSLGDEGSSHRHALPGAAYGEWLGLVRHDYDEVDRLYVDHETQGGE